jgi:hypothetical protein
MRTPAGWVKLGWTTAALSSVLAAGAVQASDSVRHEAQAMEKAKISLTQAIRTAEQRGNGQERQSCLLPGQDSEQRRSEAERV